MDKNVLIILPEIMEKKTYKDIAGEIEGFDSDIAFSKLKKLGKAKFMVDYENQNNIPEKIKNWSTYFNLKLPDGLHGPFIHISDVPLFWMSNSPIYVFVKENSKSNIKAEHEPLKLLMDYYSKWVTALRRSEKKYFAQSMQKLMDKGMSTSIFSIIYSAMLYSYEDSLRNSDEAQQYLSRAFSMTDELAGDDHIKNEFRYIITLLSGFEFYMSEKITEAVDKFQEACSLKKESTTAKFYLALCQIHLHNKIIAFDLICDLYLYDIDRIAYAVSNNDFLLFQYLIRNSIFSNIFYFPEFSVLSDMIENYLNDRELNCIELLKKLRAKFEVFIELHLTEYHDPKVIQNTHFFEKIFKTYYDNTMNTFLVSIPLLNSKFGETLDVVSSTIRERFLAEVHAQLKIYEKYILEFNEAITFKEKEIEDAKVRMKEKLKNDCLQYENHYNSHIAFWEQKLSNLGNDKQINPVSAFRSSLTYSFILSLLVMLVTGFATYTSAFSGETSGIGEIIKAVLISGGRWGGITFVLGFFISIAASGFAIVERSNHKQKIIKEIGDLKYLKEKNIQNLRVDAEFAEKNTIKSFNEKIEYYKKRILEIGDEKYRREVELTSMIEEKIQEETRKLLDLIERT